MAVSQWCAGFDCAGKPDRRRIFVPCVVGVQDVEGVRRAMAATRRGFGYGANAEIHGHAARQEVLTHVLAGARRLEVRVAAAIYVPLPQPHPRPMDFYLEACLSLFESYLDGSPLAHLHCDNDLEAPSAQQRFATDIRRLNQARWPGTRPRIRFMRSDGSDLIQLADIMAYSLARLHQGMASAPLQEVIEELQADPANVFLGPMR